MDALGFIVVAGLILYFVSKNSTLFASTTNLVPSDGTIPMPSFTPPSGGPLTVSQIAGYAAAAGFTGADVITAVAIALAESSGIPSKRGDLGIGSGSFGLWQISSYWHPEFGPDFTLLYDPQTNANAAHTIFLQAGSSFYPWTTFKTGEYAKFIPQVEASA